MFGSAFRGKGLLDAGLVGHFWIDLPVFDPHGHVLHRRGVTNVPGLYFLGLSWQHTRGSALIGWVKDDAEFLAERIASHARDRKESETDRELTAPGPARVREGV